MFYIFLSACCSVGLSVLLKLFRRYNVDLFQAITWNYAVAALLTLVFLKPSLQSYSLAPAYIYTSLGILLPFLFIILGFAISTAGIVRTDAAQRLSLLIPVITAFLLFHEPVTLIKIIAIGIGILAVLCLIPRQKGLSNRNRKAKAWLYLLIVFVGMGIIDILFKQMALFKAVPYTSSLLLVYVLAFVLCLIRLVYLWYKKSTRFAAHYVVGGILLGVVNFGNILFYLKAHQALANQPSVVFSSMNIGVIVLGTLVGVIIFREKLSLVNKLGIGLAIAAIVVLAVFK